MMEAKRGGTWRIENRGKRTNKVTSEGSTVPRTNDHARWMEMSPGSAVSGLNFNSALSQQERADVETVENSLWRKDDMHKCLAHIHEAGNSGNHQTWHAKYPKTSPKMTARGHQKAGYGRVNPH